MKHVDIAFRRPTQRRSQVTALLAIGLAFAVVSLSGATQAATARVLLRGHHAKVQPAACLYLYEWLHSVRFPLQPDPHAAYSYVIPRLPTDGTPLGFLIDADFPYAAWFSWTTYGQYAQAFSVESDHDITPDPGSTNPFVTHNPVFAPNRHYRLLLIPKGVSVAPSLADIPNVLAMPTGVSLFALAYRVYQAFPGYNQGGSSGPTNTPFPSVYAINYETGDTLDCALYNAVSSTIGRLPTDTPDVYNLYGTGSTKVWAGLDLLGLAEGTRLLHVSAFATLKSIAGFLFAPEIDRRLVTFTRPPLMPGADVSSAPPPDNCSGYLGARVDPRRIALIRLPHVASIFETMALDPNTTYPDSQGAYISLTMYGAAVNTYDPDDPDSTSLADAEFQPDDTGGSTIVVWPRDLPTRERAQLFAYARAQGWALIRGGRVGLVTTANLLFRLKGANPDYYGAYTPLPGPLPPKRTGVPCYFESAPRGTPWTAIEDAADPMSYVATFQNLGNAAPQGVHCAGTAEVLNGSCLRRLKAYIEDTGGEYFNPGDVPPPGS